MRRTSWRALLSLLVAVVAMSAATVASAAGGPHDKRGGHGHGHGHGDHHPPPPPAEKKPTAFGSGGAAATVDLLATQAAIDMMRRGGNAVDAAVAAAGVLGVTEPFSSGIGGGGFMVIRTPRGQVTTIDSRETAPATMRPDSFLENGAALAFNDARFSGMSAGVPGTVAGLGVRAQALRPHVARQGAAVRHRRRAQGLRGRPDVLRPDGRPSSTTSTTSRRRPRSISTPTARRATSARRLRNPDMARAYDMIARYGANGFYRGPIAAAMAKAAQHPPIAADANHKWRPGPDDRERPRRVPRARARADPDRLQGPRRVGHGPAVERRLDGRRDPEHPRGLQPDLGADRTQRAASVPRGVAVLVRRPRRAISAIPRTSTCRSGACCRTGSLRSAAR